MEYRVNDTQLSASVFIRWGKTPASTGGEEQICISGGCQSPI